MSSVIVFVPHERGRELARALLQARTNNPDCLLITFRPNDENNAPIDRSNRDETILDVGMVLVKHFKAVTSQQQQSHFSEGEAVVLLIGAVLRLIPRNLSPRQNTPMADSVNGVW
jgi:hypothetical protein